MLTIIKGGATIEHTEHFGFRVRIVNNLIKRKLWGYSEGGEGITQNPVQHRTTAIQNWIIRNLIDNPDKDFFQRDIESQFNIRRSTATGILKSMESNGLINRLPVGYDARLKKIVPTEKAVLEEQRTRAGIDEFEKLIIKGVSDEELAVCYAVFDKVINNLEEMK